MASIAKRKWISPSGEAKEAWAVRYHDEKGVRRSKTFALKKQADAYRRQVEREIDDGTHVSVNDSRTVEQAVKRYLEEMNQRRRDGRIGQSHYRRLNSVCELYINPILGRIVLRDLALTDVLSFYRDLNKKMSPATARLYVYYLGHIEKFSRRRGWMKTQPVADAGEDLRGIRAPTIATFKPQEVAAILDTCGMTAKGKGCRQRTRSMMDCIISLGALCGMRMGEILGLPRDEVLLAERTVIIRQSLTRFQELKGPKTAAGNREVTIPTRMLEMLQAWISEHYVPNAAGLMFTGPTGKPLMQSNVRYSWQKRLETCSLPSRRFHALRHFYASWLVHNGMPVTDAAKLLGHSHFDMTLRRYAHGLMDRVERNNKVDQIAGLLPPPAMQLTHETAKIAA